MERFDQVFCAFCRSARTIYKNRGLRPIYIVLGVFWSILLTLGYSPDLDLLGVAILLSLIGLAEIFLRIRWRLRVVCPHCGFDPVLYGQDPSRAALKVKNFLEKRKESPEFLLAPVLNLPTLKETESSPSAKLATGKSGNILSQRV